MNHHKSPLSHFPRLALALLFMAGLGLSPWLLGHASARSTAAPVSHHSVASPAKCEPDRPEDCDDPGESSKFKGRVDSMPAGSLIGDWVIDGVNFVTTEATEFESEFGTFALGLCVEVEYDPSTSPFVAVKMETKREYTCQDDDSDDDEGQIPPDATGAGELYGTLGSFPVGLVGEWQIGGMTFTATANTEFRQEHGVFAEGVTVKVEFYTGADGVNYALEIETAFANDRGEDDDGNGEIDGSEGQVFGIVDNFPAELIGTWRVGGVDYIATSATEFEQEAGTFAVGARVKVEYFLDADGNRIAHEIKTTLDSGGTDDDAHTRFVGFVQEMPSTGFIGTWVIGGVSFTADAGTKFEEDHGLLAVGAYVMAEYFVTDAGNVLHEVETQVPPGAGDHNATGEIESIDDGRALAAAVQAGGAWVVNGKTYMVTPATVLNDAQAELVVGNTVLVNSFTAADGSEVATRIAGIRFDYTIYLPITQR